MEKGIKWIVGIGVVALLCVGCFLFGKSATNDLSLIVEDGMVKYNNSGKWEEVLPLEDLFTAEDNTTVVKGKDVEFSVQDGYIVWNYVGETNVYKLIAVEDLVGAQGVTGATGKNGVDGKDGVDGKNGVDGKDGVDGKSAYIWVKYLDTEPTSAEDCDLKDDGGSFMGVYYGESSVAPATVSSYTWSEIKGKKGEKGATGAQGIQGEKGDKGDKGDAGADGKNAYVWIKYLDKAPEEATASDMKDNGGSYMGVYSGESSVAPASVSSYTWSVIKETKTSTGSTTTDPIIAGGIDINGSISVDDPIINNNNNNNGMMSEIAIYEGEITGSITNDTQLLLTEGFTYNSGDSITFDDIAKKAVLKSGSKYMITISGYAVFKASDSYLYFNIDQRSFAFEVLWKNGAGHKLHL